MCRKSLCGKGLRQILGRRFVLSPYVVMVYVNLSHCIQDRAYQYT